MKCGIDADVLVYELGFSSQYIDEDTEELVIMDFDFAAELLDQRIREIEEECWADQPSTLYLTNDPTLNKIVNRKRKSLGKKPLEYKENFRVEVAKSKKYKGQRSGEKPFHRDNLRAYMLDKYEVKIANGLEADDLLCIDGHKNPDFTICTRDKDLRMVEGRHYGWPCGKQPQFGPKDVDYIGAIELHKKDIKGWGIKFFYSQMITGDKVDNIGGLPRGGPALAYSLLADLEDEESMVKAVTDKYEEKLGEGWEDYYEEQAKLLWMIKETDSKGEPIMWSDYERY